MAAPKRFFINKLSDYVPPAAVQTSPDTSKRIIDYVETIIKQQGVAPSDCDGGLYVGLTGISYMCYYLSQHSAFSHKKQEFLDQAMFYLQSSLKYDEKQLKRGDRSMRTAFLLGSAGTHVVAAVVARALGNDDECRKHMDDYVSLANECTGRDFLGCGSDELLVGRAGYLSGVLFLQKVFEDQVVPEKNIFELCHAIVNSGIHYSKRVKSPCPLMYSYYDTEYLGAAHGLSGILQMLLSFPKYLDQNPCIEKMIRDSVDFLLGLQTPSGNFPSAMDEVARPRGEANELVHWCHGAPGVVYLMARAYLRWKETKYLQSCLSCGEIVWQKGLLKKGPGICHGVAGSGYVFLLLYRLTGDAKHLHRAVQFADFLFSDEFKSARTPDTPFSLYEGLAGTVCFLADMLDVQKAHFPFYDVF